MLVVQREDAATACMIDIWQKGIYKKTIKNGLKTRRVCPAMPNIDSNDKALLLEMRAISKVFPGVRALDEVSLKLRQGEVLALVGENGAGKSTLIKILAGAYRADQGHILIDGQNCPIASPLAAQQAGISLIYQEFNLIPDLTVRENIFLGREKTRHGFISAAAESRQAQALFQKIGIQIDPEIPCRDITIAQQQIVEIAKALSLNAKVIIMDEPTSALSDNEVESLFGRIRTLTRQGVAVVYITHKLDELARIGDRVTVMRDGQVIDTQPMQAVTQARLISMMVGRDIDAFFVKTEASRSAEVLRVQDICLDHPTRPNDYLVDHVSFTVRQGEVLGLFGLMGAGRSELLETVFGVHPHTASGRITVKGRDVLIRSPKDAIDAGIALVPEDRKCQGLVLGMSVRDSISLACLPQVESWGFLSRDLESRLAQAYVQRLHIKTTGVHQPVKDLSGGNQQKVVIAKWLATDPQVLLLDDPTRGIDVNAKNELYKLISELAQAGLAIVMVSSELPEIMTIADRIIVLSEGRQTAEFMRRDATEASILEAALPRMGVTRTNEQP